MDTTTWLHPDIPGIFGMSTGRLGATVAYVAALAGIVIGGLALRSARRRRADGGDGAGRGRPTTAIGLGLSGLVLGAVVVATADGGVGTGNGRGGGYVAIALGLVGVVLGAVARVIGDRPPARP